MAIEHQILGAPGRDNALLATVDSGHSVHRLLFDCGEGCLSQLPAGQVAEIEALFFSHFHMDHVAGFDSFLRANWDRPSSPVRIFGPPGTIDIIHHRLRGYIWNLPEGTQGEWLVTDIGDGERPTVRLHSSEGFAVRHPAVNPDQHGSIYSGACFRVDSLALDHGTISCGYHVRENDHINVATERLLERRLRPGPWIQSLKDRANIPDEAHIDVQGTPYPAGELREQLLDTTRGDSIAYLTDFHLNGRSDEDRLVRFLGGCKIIVCENNYRNAEAELAARHHHSTSAEVAAFAARVDPEKLILFHLSDRYTEADWREQLAEVRSIFPRAEFPRGWFRE